MFSHSFWDGTPGLAALQAGAFKESVPRHHNVTAGITLVPRSVFAFGHRFETTALNTIWATGFPTGQSVGGRVIVKS